MRVLLVTPFLPSADARHAGGKLVGFLREQLARRYEVVAVCRTYTEEREALEALRREGLKIEDLRVEGPWLGKGALTFSKTLASYRNLVRLAEKISVRERFDVCQVEFTETGFFWRPQRMPPAVLSCHDLIAKRAQRRAELSRGLRRPIARLAADVQAIAERRILRKFRRVLLLSDIEASWCQSLCPDVADGVLRYPGGIGFTGLPRSEVPGRVLFVGALGRPQNREGLRYLLKLVWPAVRMRRPRAELRVVGSGAVETLLEDARHVAGAGIVGEVESVEPEYSKAAVFAAPILTGGGIIVKILDALAAGVPVVTTPYGNEGIGAEPGKEILVAATPEDFSRHLVRLLADPAERRRIGEAGRRFVERRFPASGVLETIEAVYDSVLGEKR